MIEEQSGRSAAW